MAADIGTKVHQAHYRSKPLDHLGLIAGMYYRDTAKTVH